MKNDKVSILLF